MSEKVVEMVSFGSYMQVNVNVNMSCQGSQLQKGQISHFLPLNEEGVTFFQIIRERESMWYDGTRLRPVQSTSRGTLILLYIPLSSARTMYIRETGISDDQTSGNQPLSKIANQTSASQKLLQIYRSTKAATATAGTQN